MSANYEVLGPVQIPYEINSNRSKFITKRLGLEQIQSEGYSELRGCYIFCMTGSHGSIKPYYVGKSAKSFTAEAFTSDKVNKYNSVLHRVTHGKPVMMFVVPVVLQGKFNSRALTALEQYLIGLAYQCNSDIQNIQGIPRSTFEIIGIHRPKKGPKSQSLTAFTRAFKI